MEMNRRQFLVSMSLATVAAAAPNWAITTDAPGDRWPARELVASYDNGATFFKLKGEIYVEAHGDTVEFTGYVFAPKRGVGGQTLSVKHPESGLWLPVA